MDKAREIRQAELKAMEEKINKMSESLKQSKRELRKLLIEIIIRFTIIALACGYIGYTLAKPVAQHVFINENLELQADYKTYDIEISKEAK